VVAAALVAGATACVDDAGATGDRGPSVVVTTSIIGDVVGRIAGPAVDVAVLMPRGADPHEFAPSPRQVEAMTEADLVVVGGAGGEGRLSSAVRAAGRAGVEVFAFGDHVDLRVAGDQGHDDDHDEEHDADDGHDHDPHVWSDPRRVAEALPALADAVVASVAGVDGAGVRARAAAYAAELRAVDGEVATMVAAVPPARRLLVTDHEVLGYFADRYGFETVGSLIPSLTTGAAASARHLERLAELIDDRSVPAVFTGSPGTSKLADALSRAAGRRVRVVALHTESLGEPGSEAGTYLGLVRNNARRIVEALS
jgi:zinc/manganese transport system substrate-binding protein